MKERPSGSARVSLLIQALQMGEFEKNAAAYSYDSCEVCKKRFSNKDEVVFSFPKKLELAGADLPFDIQTEQGKLCLRCLTNLGDALPPSDKSLSDVMAYAKARYEKDKATIYIPEVLKGDETPKAAV